MRKITRLAGGVRSCGYDQLCRPPPPDFRGPEVSIVGVDSIVAVAAVLVVGVGHQECLVHLPVYGQVLDIGRVSCPGLIFVLVQIVDNLLDLLCDLLYLGCDLLHEVIISACLAFVNPGRDPGANWCVYG